MAQYKAMRSRTVRLFLWLGVLFLSSGTFTGAAQTVEREPVGGSIVPDNHGKGDPGATVIYQHTVKNLGSGTDTFDLTADSSEGWSVTISPDTVTLNGNQQTSILVTVVVSLNAQQGDVDVTTVTMTSQSDPGITDTATDTTVVPIPWYLPLVSNNAGQEAPDCQLIVPPPANPSGVDLIVTAISLNPNPPQAGQEAVVRVTVKNQGTAGVPVGNNFLIDFYDNPSPEPPEAFQAGVIYWGVQGAEFEAGESVTLIGFYTFQNSGFHHLYAQVDTDRAVNEANENNNVYGCLGLAIN